jgi:single-strand DNA-binding protein
VGQNINVVAITGNLTKDPELREVGSTSLCKLRVAVNGREKVDGEWTDRANYFDVTVWGKQGENAAEYLSKGRPVAVHGRLRWREWEGDSGKRQAVEIVAESIQFLGGRENREGGGGGRTFQPSSDVPADTDDLAGVAEATGGADDDIPF